MQANGVLNKIALHIPTRTQNASEMQCPDCRGHQYIIVQGFTTQHACPTCEGRGRVQRLKYLRQVCCAGVCYLLGSLPLVVLGWWLFLATR